MTDARGRIEVFNRPAEQLFGYTAAEVRGRAAHPLLFTAEANPLTAGGRTEARRKDGSLFNIEITSGAAAGGRVSLVRGAEPSTGDDNTVRELTADIVQNSRRSAMAQLASSLAHELNQPLTAVMNYAEAARQMLLSTNPPPKVLEFLEKTMAQAERAGHIIRRLRGLVENRTLLRTDENLNEVVEQASALATLGARRDGIDVIFHLAPDLPQVNIDRIQIQQVVVNLVRNAIEAVRQAERRVITVGTMVNKDGLHEVAITDSGTGVASQVAEQLFEPFVTTKKDGMGIGLSICRSIVEAHDGTLSHEPNPAGGTVFRFILPAQPPHEEV